jgi:predicted nucleic acid-binding protein
LTETDYARLLELYGTLPIQTHMELTTDALRRFVVLAKEYNLSAYDAAYLELAQRRGLRLATLDQPLIRAAREAGVQLEQL